tara:strand:+ start:1115 stop:1798 length:684 start_codon:yes stop_codon:yes gene_type:complete
VEKLVWIIIKICVLPLCLVNIFACSNSNRIDPPVFNASWRASADDRLRPIEQEDLQLVNSSIRKSVKKKQAILNRSENINLKSLPKRDKNLSALTPKSDKIKSTEMPGITPVDAPANPRTLPDSVIDLLEKAKEANRIGQNKEAIAILKRAQRISATEPEIFFQLAKVHLEQERYENAAMIAEKGLSYAGSDRAIMRDLYVLIARAKDALNDKVGANRAKRMARELL